MALVSVSGGCSRSGKTALAVTLLRGLTGAGAAVKFTTTGDVFERCPRGAPCVVCDIEVPFRIVTDAGTLGQPGTDTDRLGRAGARRVVWAIARESAVAPAWAAVRSMIEDAEVNVLEGSSIVAVARPLLRLFVAHPFLSPARWKPTSARLVAESDLVVVNRPAAEGRPPSAQVMDALAGCRGRDGVVVNRPAAEGRPPSAQVMDALAGCRGRDDVVVADVTRPLGEWAPALQARLEALR